MVTGPPQQQPQHLVFLKWAATPQHGKKADPEALKRPETTRSFEPKPGRS